MQTTGVYFHEIFKEASWEIVGERFRNFPEVMEDVLSLPNVTLIKPEKVSEDLLLSVHTPEFLDGIKKRWDYEAACFSVGGCVEASWQVMSGEMRNALVFNLAAGHHASPSHAWGGTYISSIGPAVSNLRKMGINERFAILDTDAHHGDGTRAIFMGDHDVLHVCFCYGSRVEDEGTKIDIDPGWKTSDEEYLELVRQEFVARVDDFSPSLIFHELGYDTCRGDYGDRGLSPEFFIELVREVKRCAERVCEGRYIVITMGGARRETAEYIFPRIVEVMAE
ncbi:MAG TPA: histone deacetylase [Candidatus Syntrophoarchaeum butanivorans]|uniref:Histone deacetylase n=1 Tax=Candidatus Syntropharchaeum butanivorans TaxID=1839936 RepID=A0A1F2P4R2_9EURY|nr:MAG: histone deacetylase [Candidatus Syntrophoarchaeum butanivorans]HEC57111.1 histone deacetylase [Candidatus Syntrophoarchaeum butanivorans]